VDNLHSDNQQHTVTLTFPSHEHLTLDCCIYCHCNCSTFVIVNTSNNSNHKTTIYVTYFLVVTFALYQYVMIT